MFENISLYFHFLLRNGLTFFYGDLFGESNIENSKTELLIIGQNHLKCRLSTTQCQLRADSATSCWHSDTDAASCIPATCPFATRISDTPAVL